ncbi:MAG TPA: MBL fold metallo-hydrolase [Motilibacteraceae bacterium]|nr:MBL fold metallo-hydrolase [Motilibacteraceae bacterium]
MDGTEGTTASAREGLPENVTRLGDDVFAIDTRMSGFGGITAGYLVLGERPCLVETGTATSAPVVRESLAALGVGPQDLATVVVTHIHLDHAGGAGDIAEAFPRAQVVVHELGARHLVDPTKLMTSARRVFGDVLDNVLGLLRPTPQERVVALGDVGSIDLGGGRRLDSFHAPGHAKHHVGLLDSQTGDLYVGDAAGIYVPETADVRPATPPPDFDLDVACASLQRFRDVQPTRLLFSHFGPVSDVQLTLDRSEEELRLWVELVRDARGAKLDLDHAVAMVLERTRERYARFLAMPEVVEKFEELNQTAANIVGINRWLDRVTGETHDFGDAAAAR